MIVVYLTSTQSEKRRPITASDISGPTGLCKTCLPHLLVYSSCLHIHTHTHTHTHTAKSPSDHGLSSRTSPPRHSPSPDHAMPSHTPSRGVVKNLSESFGITQAGPANTRYTFPGENGEGTRGRRERRQQRRREGEGEGGREGGREERREVGGREDECFFCFRLQATD